MANHLPGIDPRDNHSDFDDFKDWLQWGRNMMPSSTVECAMPDYEHAQVLGIVRFLPTTEWLHRLFATKAPWSNALHSTFCHIGTSCQQRTQQQAKMHLCPGSDRAVLTLSRNRLTVVVYEP